MKPTIHVIGLPHTIVSQEYSHCAFTGKILRFPSMMIPLGWRVVEYSNEGSESGASKHVQILTRDELKNLSARKSNTEQYGDDVHNKTLVNLFKDRTYRALQVNVVKHDIVCHVFGPHHDLVGAAKNAFHLESGIGYSRHDGMQFRIFESAYWMGWHSGRNHKGNGSNYEWVCPNSYTIEEWKFNPTPKDYILFFGRLNTDKGLRVILEIAKRLPEKKFILCGQGDPTPWIDEKTLPNLTYLPPIFGLERSELLGNASIILTPSIFIEPFCGVAVEAQLCGTPVVSSCYGAFLETVVDGVTGYRCNTLADYVEAIIRAPSLDREFISNRARSLYDKHVVAKSYDRIFKQIADLGGRGWYSELSHKFD